MVKKSAQADVLVLSPDERAQFEAFLKHRRLNDAAIETLKSARSANDLRPQDLQTAKNLTYPAIADNLIRAVNRGWLDMSSLVDFLDGSELAGKQHVCVFSLPKRGAKAIMNTLRQPTGSVGATPKITDFLSVPSSSSVRLLLDTPNCVVSKIVTQRAYWLTNLVEQDPDRELLERLRNKERAAVIVKCDTVTGLVQIRVPPREKGPDDTVNAVYQFMKQALESHYPVDEQSWLYKLERFPVGDAFPAILNNRTDFELAHDTPEDRNTRARVSKKGRPKAGSDLRDEKSWQYGQGYSRKNMRGFWKCPASQSLYVHMNADLVRIDQKTRRDIARLVISQLCSDEDLDYVIQRIRDHL